VVPRATEVYAEIGRMLWHPVSLHKPGEAAARAHQLLGRMAARVRMAPGVPAVIAAEIADLMDGDVPFFTTVASHGQLDGPRGTVWLRPANLVDEALDSWRQADFDLERRVIRATLVSAYINDGWVPPEVLLKPAQLQFDRLDARRRSQAARIMKELVASRLEGDDGTVTWIAPILNPSGWSVQPLEQDLYGGASGIALLVAAYLREVEAGRADPVEGVDRLLPQLLKTLHSAEDQRDRQREEVKKPRPASPGSYIGLGSQIWTWLTLASWGIDAGRSIERACSVATHLLPAIEADDVHDLLIGKAGAIVPLLKLWRVTGQRSYLDLATQVGERLCADAVPCADRGGVHWRHPRWPDGLGGYVHGATGIGWALAKLHEATCQPRFAEVASAAFAFEASLFDPAEQNWLDLRLIEGVRTAAAWCHGAVGIGLALVDLHSSLRNDDIRRQVRCAADAAWRMGTGWNHSLCHGDLGVFELLSVAVDAGLAPQALTREHLLAHVLGSMEQHGATCGITRDTFSPGLLPGLGGVAYQLLRAHPESCLPSVLILDAGGRPGR
jgi:type 2 lantibiotic biosynthesis protein LanM